MPDSGQTQSKTGVPRQRRLRSLSGVRIAESVIVTLATMLLARVGVGALSGPSAYEIMVAGNFSPQGAALSMQKTLAACDWKDVLLDGRTVRIRAVDDVAAGPRLTAEQIAARNDTLMVVGHFTSTTTSQALPVYLTQDSPIPVLLTTETNPDLVPKASAEGDPEVQLPVFRLWPTDDKQAEDAADYAASKGTTFWVVEDMSNNYVYSHYLAEKFTEHILRRTGKKVVLWSNNRSLPSPETLHTYGIDAVFFPGGWQDALVLIHAVNTAWAQNPEARPKIFLTDGSANADMDLLIRGGADIEGVFVTHPMSADQYMQNSGFEDLARDACNVIMALVAEADQHIKEHKHWFLGKLDYHSVSDARRAIAGAMHNLSGVEIKGTRVSYRFLKDNQGRYITQHDDCDARFHLWQAKHNGTGELEFADAGQDRQPTQCEASS